MSELTALAAVRRAEKRAISTFNARIPDVERALVVHTAMVAACALLEDFITEIEAEMRNPRDKKEHGDALGA